jgi:hypothetical protein
MIYYFGFDCEAFTRPELNLIVVGSANECKPKGGWCAQCCKAFLSPVSEIDGQSLRLPLELRIYD